MKRKLTFNIKRFFYLSFVISMIFLSSCSKTNIGKDLYEIIKEKGQITIAMEGTWAPWTYHDENEKLVGFDTEIGEEIAKRLGVKANFVEGEWDSLFAGLDSERFDIVINGVEITDERKEKYDFSIPYCYIKTAIITRTDNDDIKSFTDLKGKTTANSINSTYMNIAEAYGAKVSGVDSIDETMDMVLSKRVDATLNAEVSFYDYMKVHSQAPLKVVALSDDASEVAIAFRKEKTKTLREEIDKIINDLRNDGTLSNISNKYFNKDIVKK